MIIRLTDSIIITSRAFCIFLFLCAADDGRVGGLVIVRRENGGHKRKLQTQFSGEICSDYTLMREIHKIFPKRTDFLDYLRYKRYNKCIFSDSREGRVMSLFHKNNTPKISYDSAVWQPAVRRSICTGEMTVGFVDRGTGKFREYQLARDQKELETFCRNAGIEPNQIKTIY